MGISTNLISATVKTTLTLVAIMNDVVDVGIMGEAEKH